MEDIEQTVPQGENKKTKAQKINIQKETLGLSKINGYSFIQVKTVQMGKYEDYDNTNMFYLSLGFKEFEVFPTLWDEWNPCQVYVMSIK